MKKIPTLFKRDFADPRHPITREPAVILPLGAFATRKFDGMAIKCANERLYLRREVRQGEMPPEDWEPCQEPDSETGKCPGWIPETQQVDKRLQEATNPLANPPIQDGTYELCGPKVNGNPEHFQIHILIPHGAERLDNCPTDYDGIRTFLATRDIEGIVWWTWANGPIAKIKKRDFGLRRPPNTE